MICNISVTSLHDNLRVMRARKSSVGEGDSFLVRLKPNKNNLNKNISSQAVTVLKSENQSSANMNLLSDDFELERGLYDVTVARIREIQGKNIITDQEEAYPEPIMIGKKYILNLWMSQAECYDTKGVKVKIVSVVPQIELDSKSVYYKIRKKNRGELKSDLKYYIPFHNSGEIEFFIQGVDMNEVELGVANPCFELNRK